MNGGLRLKAITKQTTNDFVLVSIITVVYNAEKYLEQTIQSVLNQSYKNIEYIIIDGGSKDKTLSIIKNYEDRIDYWQSEPDKGIYDAMNKGIALAKGGIIGILNADDFYFEDSVKHIIDADKKYKADIYYGDILSINDTKLPETKSREIPDIFKMKQKPSIYHPTCFVKKTVYEKAGLFDIQYKISSDYEFLLRCLNKKYMFNYVPELITAFRIGGASASCYSNVEGYKIMKKYNTGHQNEVIWRGLKCYAKTFIKKIINLKK